MLSIDEAIAQAREVSSRKFDDRVHCVRCSEFHKQIAEWLEELKALRNGLKIKCDSLNEALEKGKNVGYNKALDDFVKFANTMPTVETEDGEIRPMRLEEMAERLKEGGNNGT